VIEFANKTFWGALTVTGRFTEFRGHGSLTDEGAVTGQITIRAASLRTGIGKRDDHLRSADFFDVEHHPDITAEVAAAGAAETGRPRLQVALTVRGVTRTLEFPAALTVLGDDTVGLRAGTTVERAAFGVTGNMIGMVGPTTTLTGRLVFRRAASK
jgi:polyisoprenoid-binding protein YceI